jgi:GTP cyclohydrolase IA
MEDGMDRQKIMGGVKAILEGLGEDNQREGLQDTPRRVAEMLEDILSGINQTPVLEADISEEVVDDLIIIRDVPFYSICEHHLLPFFGKVHLAYIPKHNKISGFSAITRLVDSFSHRLQIQERFTRQIADAMMKFLDPRGVLVIVEAQQLCVSMRGTKKDSVKTVTRASRGEMSPDCLPLLGFKTS